MDKSSIEKVTLKYDDTLSYEEDLIMVNSPMLITYIHFLDPENKITSANLLKSAKELLDCNLNNLSYFADKLRVAVDEYEKGVKG